MSWYFFVSPLKKKVVISALRMNYYQIKDDKCAFCKKKDKLCFINSLKNLGHSSLISCFSWFDLVLSTGSIPIVNNARK